MCNYCFIYRRCQLLRWRCYTNWTGTERKTSKYSAKYLSHSATFSITNVALTSVGRNPILCSDKPETKLLAHKKHFARWHSGNEGYFLHVDPILGFWTSCGNGLCWTEADGNTTHFHRVQKKNKEGKCAAQQTWILPGESKFVKTSAGLFLKMQ